MALRETLLPPLPRNLQRLYDYLLRRDDGAPSPGLALLPLEQDSLDRIAWQYTPPVGIDRRDPDGFLVWWQAAATADPLDGGVLVDATARAFSMSWPDGATRSYAVAPCRLTYRGIVAGPKQQHDTWKGAT